MAWATRVASSARWSISSGGECTFGDRVGRVRDPLGNVWWIQARVEEVSPQEVERRLSDPVFTEAMRYVQGADFFGPGPGAPAGA
jgi:PhnB protein